MVGLQLCGPPVLIADCSIISSVHCNIFFPNSISILKILWIDSGKRPPAVPSRTSRSPPPAAGSVSPATTFEGQRVMRRGNTVGAAEAGSRCLTHRSFWDSKLRAQPVSPWPLHRAPMSSTLLLGERGGSVSTFTPSCLPGGRRDCGHFYVYVRQKCTMQSQKQWHFLSLTMVSLF